MPFTEMPTLMLKEAAKESVKYGETIANTIKELESKLPDVLLKEKTSLEAMNSLGKMPSLKEFMEGLKGNRPETVQQLHEIKSWIGEVNPNFDPFDVESPYCNNCGSCALAVYKRLEGMGKPVASAVNIGYNHEMEALTGMKQVSMHPEAIRQYLIEQGNGAHAIIGVDRAFGSGHWFNAANIDGEVVAIDGQSGEVFSWPPDYGFVTNWEISI